MLGIIGGMGPLATVDFLAKLLEETPVASEEEHVPTLVVSDPRLPSRTAAILGDGASPLPALRSIRDRLLGAGATVLAMPCNTAHFWYDDLVRDCAVPFISIVEASCAAAAEIAATGSAVGVVATRATLAARIFEQPLTSRSYRPLLPTGSELAQSILPAIRLVKDGDARRAGERLAPAMQALLERGAAAVILACTETPVALDAIRSPLRARCIDSNRALARACVAHWRGAAQPAAGQPALRSA
jgi:aspartate racemase